MCLERDRRSARIPSIMKRRVFSLSLAVVLFAGISLLGQEKAAFAQEKNVKPGIKEKSLDLEFKLADWLKEFEV